MEADTRAGLRAGSENGPVVVLGQPDFTTFVEPDLTQQKNNVSAKQLLNPVAVSYQCWAARRASVSRPLRTGSTTSR